MILPVGASSFKEAMKMGVEVYHHLKVDYSFFLLHISFGYLKILYLGVVPGGAFTHASK